MANRRFGGGMGGGPQRGNRSFVSQQPYQGNQGVNPWQGGVAPNNSANPGLLSQLSTPQQLALALTSLLQPQQQQQNNPPSLLSLNTSPFSGQDHYDNQNRFGNRGRSDFRRVDSYKQNRNNNWRAETNRRNAQPYNNRRNTFNRGRSQDNKTPERPKPAESRPKTEEKPKAVEKEATNDTTAETIDLSVDEGRDEEARERKRDWKEEKNLSDDKEKQEESEVPSDEKKEEKDENNKREGRYQGVPPGYLHCFVCNKSMWDGESFQNHLRGKAHKQMLQSLEESFQITVNILRENMRLKEEQKMIELNRMHRNNRNYRKVQEPQSTCNMCDLKFMGKIIVHRKTEGHQRLKRFLHPSCEVCNKEFPARMEWVEHKFTPEHLRALKESLDGKVGGEDGAIIVENLEVILEPLLEETLQNEDDTPVLELSDDMTNFQNRIPAYKKNRPVSKESLEPSSGFLCSLCNRFFPSEQIAQAHLSSEKHYYAFVEAAKNKYKRAASDKAEDDGNWKRRKLDDTEVEGEAKEKEDTSANGGNEMYDPEEACNENENNQEVKEEPENQDDGDDKWAEAEEMCAPKAKTENKEVEIKVEAVDEEETETAVGAATNSPRTRRGIAAAAAKNGTPGPKAKRGRK